MLSPATVLNLRHLLEPHSFRWSNPLLVALALSLILGLVFYLVARWFLRQSLPRRGGLLRVSGIEGVVTIDRDSFGIPLIEADSVPDLLFGQGFAQAQDRLWQMELNRRIGAGRLSELFGPDAKEADIFLRRLGLQQAAEADLEALTEEERRHLEAFCEGINECIKGTKTLPVEFRLLKCSPEPWEPLDSLTWVQVMSMDLCANWEQELLRGRILEKLGPDGAELLHLFGSEAGLTVPPGGKGPEVLKGLWELYDQAKAYLPNGGFPGGSNAWAVSGKRSRSGNALLAGDPHLVGRVPSIWYESQLRCPDFDVQGAGFPGIPFIVMGANKHVSWAITNSYADTQDLFVEKFQGDQYETADGLEPIIKREEVVSVKGQAAHTEMVESTRHGPVLFRNSEHGLALKWKNFEPSNPVGTLLKMNRASSIEEFREALRSWQAPSSNFVYADVEGGIGYSLAGHVPIRKAGSGLTPVPGWNDEFEWSGEVPFEEMPHVHNPECGYVVSANNPVVGPDFKHFMTWDWMGAARAERIEQMILETKLHDIDNFEAMQVDTYCSTGARFADLCQEMGFAQEDALTARKILADWDGDGSSVSGEMALYQVTYMTLVKKVIEEVLGPDLGAQFLGLSSNPVAIMAGHTGRHTIWLMDLLEQPDKYHRLRKFGKELPSSDVLVEECLVQAYRELCGAFGRDPRAWEWGKLHRLQFKHPLAINPVLGAFLNSPRGSAGGDTDTVFQTAINPQSDYSAEAWCPSFRQIVEMGDEVEYRAVLPTGQSGHPASRNYMNQFHHWCAGRLRTKSSRGRAKLELRPEA